MIINNFILAAICGKKIMVAGALNIKSKTCRHDTVKKIWYQCSCTGPHRMCATV